VLGELGLGRSSKHVGVINSTIRSPSRLLVGVDSQFDLQRFMLQCYLQQIDRYINVLVTLSVSYPIGMIAILMGRRRWWRQP